MARLRCLQCRAVFDSRAAVVTCPSCQFHGHAGAFYKEPATSPATHVVPASPVTTGIAQSAPAMPGVSPQAAPVSIAPETTSLKKVPARRWVLSVLWLIALVSFVFESILFLMAGDEATLAEAGIQYSLPLLALALAGALFGRLAIGFLTAWDLKAQGAQRLKMAILPITQYERTSPTAWGWLAGILTIPSLAVLTIMRGKLRRLSRQALTASTFSDKKQRKAALKKKDFFPKAEFKAMKSRQGWQALVFLGMWAVLAVVSRL